MKKVIFPLVAGLLVSTGACAADSNFYVLGGAGQTRLSYPKASTDTLVSSSLVAPLFTSSTKDNPTAYKVQLGYQIDSRWAIEAGYLSLGTISYNATGTAGAPATAFSVSQSTQLKGMNVNAIGTFPVSDAFSVSGKFGFTRIDSTISATTPQVGSTYWLSNNLIKTGVTYGAAVKFDVNKNFFVRGDIDSYDTGSSTGRFNVWTVNAGYNF
jgi:OOP family OmpA-OmpF porin